MSDVFWVYPEQLEKSAEGFHVRGTVIAGLADRVNTLMGAQLVSALGDDSEGRALLEETRRDVGDLHRGVRSWGEAVSGTGDAVVQAARTFTATEEGNTQLARTFSPDSRSSLPTTTTSNTPGSSTGTTTPTTRTTPRVPRTH